MSCLPLLGDSDGEKASALGFGAKEKKEGIAQSEEDPLWLGWGQSPGV